MLCYVLERAKRLKGSGPLVVLQALFSAICRLGTLPTVFISGISGGSGPTTCLLLATTASFLGPLNTACSWLAWLTFFERLCCYVYIHFFVCCVDCGSVYVYIITDKIT